MTIALFPTPSGAVRSDVRGGRVRIGRRPTSAVFIRRRIIVGLIALGLLVAFGVAALSVLADRGGVPASTPAIRPVNAAGSNIAAAGTVIAAQHIIQPGDTMWGLAEVFHGRRSVTDYVDALVAANNGPTLQIGQLLVLP